MESLVYRRIDDSTWTNDEEARRGSEDENERGSERRESEFAVFEV